MPRKNKTLKNNTLQTFIDLAKKYRVNYKNRTKKQIADSLSGLRGSYLSKKEKNIILPYLSNNVNKRILLQNYNKTQKKIIKKLNLWRFK